MSKHSNEMEDLYGNNSKRRKTAHISNMTEEKLLQNPMKNFNLLGPEDTVEQELERRSPELNYAINSYKKRTYNKVDTLEQAFISKIPKPTRDFNIFYSKYCDFPTLIPKYKYPIQI